MKISKKPFLGIVLIALNFNILAQVGIGTSNPHASAALEIQSTSKGFLFPRMTKVARNAISNIATGLTIYLLIVVLTVEECFKYTTVVIGKI